MRRQDRGSHGSRNSGDATPRQPGRPTTWPTMADVQEVNEDKVRAGILDLRTSNVFPTILVSELQRSMVLRGSGRWPRYREINI